ncbi:glycyl-radical enzyme activating protein [Vagococcus elongatus]|uniref:Pyruvate formate lyase-activating protein n=1 Tax=Vagococcus elongatus TaxID=180344 RepID=A0A430APV4_9ENTE|nr:glycyl-radical enzyme activating protein [Vagococcus elongatus]RSU10152.1 pyruvate formate lyase-activating protein [Vagococcus elongatus]
MQKGLVFNIQRYSIHDGGGIRTIVFLKGCPLACPWCSNPESRKAVEPVQWIKNGKKEIIGEWKTSAEVIDEVLKDEIFYRTSGGGVTLSGGEVLMQHLFAKEVLSELHYLGINTAIETTGCFEKERLESLLPFTDEVLFDIKILDMTQAKKVIGINLKNMKENFEMALQFPGVKVTPRIPLIPDYTATEENIEMIINYFKNFDIKEVHLLPFHQYGSSKYDYLGWEYLLKDMETLSDTEIDQIKKRFESHGFYANIEGLE